LSEGITMLPLVAVSLAVPLFDPIGELQKQDTYNNAPAVCPACQLVTLDWAGVQVGNNNLYETGGELRFEKAGQFEGKDLDVVITNSYSITNTKACDHAAAGGVTGGKSSDADGPCRQPTGKNNAAEHFGGLAVIQGPDYYFSGTMTLRYSDSDEEAVVPMFCMTWVDLDWKAVEFIEIGGYGNTFSHYDAGSDIVVENVTWGSDYPMDVQNAVHFSTNSKKGVPNPTEIEPWEMTAAQRAAAIEVFFSHTSSYDFVVGTKSSFKDGQCCQYMWFSGGGNLDGQCPDIAPAPPPPPPSPGGTEVCNIVGDPHVKTFGEYHCFAHGFGSFRALKDGTRQVQTFHCPSQRHMGNGATATNVVAVAITDGDEVIEIVGEEALVDGSQVFEQAGDTYVGDMSFFREDDGNGIKINVGDLRVVTRRKDNDKLPTEYDMDVHITIPADMAVAYGSNKQNSLCTLTGGHKSSGTKSSGSVFQSLAESGKAIIFTTETLTALQDICVTSDFTELLATKALSTNTTNVTKMAVKRTLDKSAERVRATSWDSVSSQTVATMNIPKCGE